MYLHNKNNMRHFCITNKKKQKTSIFIFGQWVFWPIVVIVLLVIIFILPAYWSVINFDQLRRGLMCSDTKTYVISLLMRYPSSEHLCL